MRKLIIRKESGNPIEERIGGFILALKEIAEDKKAVSTLVRNELRWLGVEKSELRYALTTTRNYLSRYRTAIELELPADSAALVKLGKLKKSHPEELKSVDLEAPASDIAAEVRSAMSASRKINNGLYDKLAKIKVLNNAYYKLHLKKQQTTIIKVEYGDSVAEKQDNQLSISLAAVQAAVDEGLVSDNNRKRLVALCLASGRRPNELYKSASFAEDEKGWLRFSGQAKKKNKVEAAAYSIPIYFTSVKKFLAAFDAYRESIGDQSETSYRTVNNRLGAYSQTARDMLRSDDATLYTCRAVYAAYHASLANSDDPKEKNRLISKVLGHEVGDTSTVNSYLGIHLTNTPVDQIHYEGASGKRERVLPIAHNFTKASQKAEERSRKISDNRPDRLRELTPTIFNRPMMKLHEWLIEYIEANPGADITQTLIRRERGGTIPAIQKYFAVAGDALLVKNAAPRCLS